MNAAAIYDQWAHHLLICNLCSEAGPAAECLHGPAIFSMAQEAVREVAKVAARQAEPEKE